MFTSYCVWALFEPLVIIFCSISCLATLCNFQFAGIRTYIESHSVDVFGYSMSNYVMNHLVRLLAYISLWEALTHCFSVNYFASMLLLVLGIISMFIISLKACYFQQSKEQLGVNMMACGNYDDMHDLNERYCTSYYPKKTTKFKIRETHGGVRHGLCEANVVIG